VTQPAVFLAGLAALGAAGLAALAFRRPLPFIALIVTGCGLVTGSALSVLTGPGDWEVVFRARLPGGAWVFGLDALSAFFLLAITVVGAAAAVYGTGSLARDPRRGAVSFAHATVAVLIVALCLVVAARAVVPFLVAWELMAIAAFVLVMFDHEQADTRRAGLLYLVATHTATLALIALFAWWGSTARDLSFAALGHAAAAARFPAGAVLLLALVGFGLKAGLVPLHFWLPAAHAAAPSHVSALMSGLVIKTGIYGLLRVAALLGGGGGGGAPEWYGWTLLGLGIVSGVLGVVWALAQHDLKRLLAYHSVENIGIMLIGMGVGTLGAAYRLPVVAALGYGGAILHVLNHALFKGLLFLGAGSVAHGAGTRRIDALGGLSRLMPVTWLAFLVGSVAIVGLPPLNGFVSEWTIGVALVQAGLGEGAGAIRVAVFGVAALGLIGALALACFAKVGGIVFLGSPRTAGAAGAHESGPLMLVPMLALALACVAIGLLPWLVVPRAFAAAAVVAGPGAAGAGFAFGADVARLGATAALLAVLIWAGWTVRRALLRGRSRAVALTWGCAYPAPTPRMQYTASSFAAPVLEPFGALAGRRAERTGTGLATHPLDPVLHDVLQPAWRRMKGVAIALRAVQVGRLHVYLLYVLATVVALLAYLALGPR
jgi:formate hydrogenlyase subunit 3/multisubunit Na+/H+ antiporter MnhD subunit